MNIETLIQSLAALTGIVAITAPIYSVLLQIRHQKGRSSGPAPSSRNWPGVTFMMAGLITIGFVLWEPLPLHFSTQLNRLFPVMGTLFYFPGVGLYLWGLATLRSYFGVSNLLGADLYQDHQLITSGPYAVIRHPMYMGVLLASIGALIIFRTWAMLLFAPMSLVVFTRAAHEEDLLQEEFGNDWQRYTLEVSKWIPGKFKKR